MDIYQIRKDRLKQIIRDDFGDNQSAFSSVTGYKATQVNRWLSETTTDPRNITESSARKIEQRVGKPDRWLDGIEEKTSLYPRATDDLSSAPKQLNGNKAVYRVLSDPIEEVIAIMQAMDRPSQQRVIGAAKLIQSEYLKANQNSTKRPQRVIPLRARVVRDNTNVILLSEWKARNLDLLTTVQGKELP